MIRKRICEKNYVHCITTHILTGERVSKSTPPINLKIGDVVPIKIIQKTGIRDVNGNTEVPPVFLEKHFNNVEVLNIYEKLFIDLSDHDLEGVSPIIKDADTLALYLALIYDCTKDDVIGGHVTIVKTRNIS